MSPEWFEERRLSIHTVPSALQQSSAKARSRSERDEQRFYSNRY